jgi:hypothetical protein
MMLERQWGFMTLVCQGLHFHAIAAREHGHPPEDPALSAAARNTPMLAARQKNQAYRKMLVRETIVEEMTYPEKPYCSFSFFRAQQPESFQLFLLVGQRLVLLFPAPDSDRDIILHPLRAHQSCPLLVPWWVRSALHEW